MTRRRRLARVRILTYKHADTGLPVRVQRPTLWGRIVWVWDWWRTPR